MNSPRNRSERSPVRDEAPPPEEPTTGRRGEVPTGSPANQGIPADDVAAPDVAARHDRRGEDDRDSGRDRLLAVLRKPGSRGQITAAVLLAVVGFGAVVQVQANESADKYAGMRQEDLIQILNSLSAASQRAEQQIAELEQTRNTLRSSTDSRQAALEQARQQADVLGILAGTLPAVGPGVRVTVKDPNGGVGVDQLLDGIQELRDAGAEAIEINDTVRIVAQTAFASGENGVVVDNQQLTAPYTIEAIGDPQTLANALDFTGGFIDDVERAPVSGSVVVEKLANVEIVTTREPQEPEYADPVEDQ